jgi:DNA repair protein RadC
MTFRKIKDLPVEDRPREKLKKFGSENLSNRELIAILLRTGNIHHGSALDLAQQILSKCNHSLKNLLQMELSELLDIPGIGEAKGITLKASLELAKRVIKDEILFSSPSFTNPETVYTFLKMEIAELEVEEFRILLLDSSNQLIDTVTITRGLVNETLIHPREVFKEAIRKNATSVILVHNHPSGNPNPSQQDIHITGKINESGKILGIPVLDHIIITYNSYFSFQEEGML